MVARNEEKMQKKLIEIQTECRSGDKDFKTMYVVADFGSMFTIEDYKKKIADKVVAGYKAEGLEPPSHGQVPHDKVEGIEKLAAAYIKLQ